MILITYPNADIRTIRRERYSHPGINDPRALTNNLNPKGDLQ
jgi:hypothetical protein